MSVQTQEELAAANLEEARHDIEASEIGKAFSALDRALTETHDPILVKEAYELAVQAYAKASFMQRHVLGGHSILKAAEDRIAESHD